MGPSRVRTVPGRRPTATRNGDPVGFKKSSELEDGPFLDDLSGLIILYHLVIFHSHGKSPFLIGKPSINGPFSMAMLNNQRVTRFIIIISNDSNDSNDLSF